MARELGVTSGAVALWETGARAMPGPALRLVELYERELIANGDEPSAPRLKFIRRASTGFSSVIWYGLSRMLPETRDDSVAGRVRAAVIRRYVQTLGELKGLSMKLAQMIGYMAPLLPEDVRVALLELPTSAPPTPASKVALTIDAELGGPPTDLFASWDPKPFAVASIGQVHRAEMRDGRAVAERDAAGETIWSFYWESALRDGLFNTDPQPGNFAFRSDQVVFFDFGRVKRFSAPFLPIWRRLFRAVLERDRDGVTRAFLELGSVASPDRFDAEYGFRSMVACFLPYLVDAQPFAFDADVVGQAWRVYVLENVNMPVIHFTSDMIMLHQLQFGLTSVLARLGARVRCRDRFLDLLYEPGETRPAPYRRAEIAAFGLTWTP
jgi:hypothetical protein